MLSRRSILIAASAFALTSALAATPQAFDATAFADAQKNGKPILVAVHASWCPTCKTQGPILGDLLANPKYRNVAYFVIDFDSQKDLVKRFGVRMQSTLIAFKGSQEEAQYIGPDRKSIAALLNKAF